MGFFEKGELNILKIFYIEYFIASVLMFAPAFFIVYFLSLNLTLLQIGTLMAMAPLTSLLFEIPTGAVADLYGRKFSTICGYIIEGICMLSFFFARNYYTILVLFALWGIGMTFSSGSKDAWIVEIVKKKDKKLLKEFFNKQQIFISSGLILSGIVGSVFVKYFDLKIIWLIAAFSYVCSITLLALFTKEIFTNKKPENLHIKEVVKQARVSWKYAYNHPVIFYLFIALFFSTLAFIFGENLSFVPLLQSLNFPEYAFGYLWSGLWGIMIIAPIIAKKVIGKSKEINFIMLCMGLGSFALLLIYYANEYWIALIIMGIAMLFFGMESPISRNYFHRFVPNKLRATIGSILGMIYSLASIVGLLIGGYLIDNLGAKVVIIIAALLGIPSIIFYSMIKDKISKKQ